jgi:hypothetical protein
MSRPLPILRLAALGVLALAACGNPRAGPDTPRPANNAPVTPRVEPAVLLQPAHAAGARFRTTRTLRVEELTETERFLTEASEITHTRVLAVDDRGRLMAVRVNYEQSLTRLTRGFGAPEEGLGELHGCTLELRRHHGGVTATVVAGDARIGGQTFVMEGFEHALLPATAVRRGDRWQLDAGSLAGINRFIEAVGFRIEKNELRCVLAALDAESAEISLDWQVSGELRGRTAVLALTGVIVFDRRHNLVRELRLAGGRRGQGQSQQIEIVVRRRLTDGWLDLDD